MNVKEALNNLFELMKSEGTVENSAGEILLCAAYGHPPTLGVIRHLHSTGFKNEIACLVEHIAEGHTPTIANLLTEKQQEILYVEYGLQKLIADHIDQWEHELDMMGPLASHEKLSQHLENAPPEAPSKDYLTQFLAGALH